MKSPTLLAIFISLHTITQAQFKNVLKQVKNRIENTGGEKNNVSDTVKKDKTPPSSPVVVSSREVQGEPSSNTTVTSYSKFDFVPGENVIYQDDFSQDNIGELPLLWNTTGKGEIVNLQREPGKWFRLFPGSNYFGNNKTGFGKNFTIEFDVWLEGIPSKYTPFFPLIELGLYNKGSNNLKPSNQDNFFRVRMQPSAGKDSRMELESMVHSEKTFKSGIVTTPFLNQSFSQKAHYAFQIQNNRLRFWVNEKKIFDAPQVVNMPETLNNLFFNLESNNFYDESSFGLYISNIKVAIRAPDTRHKLLDEGKFSTSGILFAANSAAILPQSYGIIKEIADLLKESPSVKIKIIGHTSSEGDASTNLELSRNRALAVKDVLVKSYGLQENLIQTDGKGSTQPVADNKTQEGRAQNRRVEFIKL